MIRVVLIIWLIIMLSIERAKRDKAEQDTKFMTKLFDEANRLVENRKKMDKATMPLDEYLDAAEHHIRTAYTSKDHQRKLRAFLRDLNEARGIIHSPLT